MARDRLLTAASGAGAEVNAVGFGQLVASLGSDRVDLLVVDLDGGREPALEEIESARQRGLLPTRVVGYFSHVDDDLARAARKGGCEPIARGKFWQQIGELVE